MGNRKLKQQKRRMGTLERKPKQKETENIQEKKETENTNKKYLLFQLETNDTIINIMENKAMYDHYQILSPLEKKMIQDMTTLELLKQKYGD